MFYISVYILLYTCCFAVSIKKYICAGERKNKIINSKRDCKKEQRILKNIAVIYRFLPDKILPAVWRTIFQQQTLPQRPH